VFKPARIEESEKVLLEPLSLFGVKRGEVFISGIALLLGFGGGIGVIGVNTAQRFELGA
jgi:hypothetical protein